MADVGRFRCADCAFTDDSIDAVLTHRVKQHDPADELTRLRSLNKRWNTVMSQVLAGSEYYDEPERYVKRFRQLGQQVIEQAKGLNRLRGEVAELQGCAEQSVIRGNEVIRLGREVVDLRAEIESLRQSRDDNKRYLDAVAQALHPDKPPFTEERWTYLPDQLAGMVRALREKT